MVVFVDLTATAPVPPTRDNAWRWGGSTWSPWTLVGAFLPVAPGATIFGMLDPALGAAPALHAHRRAAAGSARELDHAPSTSPDLRQAAIVRR